MPDETIVRAVGWFGLLVVLVLVSLLGERVWHHRAGVRRRKRLDQRMLDKSGGVIVSTRAALGQTPPRTRAELDENHVWRGRHG